MMHIVGLFLETVGAVVCISMLSLSCLILALGKGNPFE